MGFDIALTNVQTTYQRCFNVRDRFCINVVQSWKSEVGFCFIFNLGSTLFQRWFTTLKQRWSDVEMLAGNFYVSVWIMLKEVHASCGRSLCVPWFYLSVTNISWLKSRKQHSYSYAYLNIISSATFTCNVHS